MKYEIMLKILFTLLSRRKISAAALAAEHGVSVRTVYRYLDEMTCAGVPIDVARGANGGVYISDAYKLPKGFMTKEEYGRTLEAMLAMKEQTGDPVLAAAVEKVSAQMKSEKFDLSLSGNILVDSGTWGDERKFSEKLSVAERAVAEKETLEIDYVSREGERTRRKIQPHLLVYKQNVWYVWAYCTTRNDFRLFKLGRMRSMVRTGETFERRSYRRGEIPLSFWTDAEKTVSARFALSPAALPFAEEWLGVDNVFCEDGAYYADAVLPDDDALVGKILSAGAGMTVVSPPELRERVKKEAEAIASANR